MTISQIPSAGSKSGTPIPLEGETRLGCFLSGIRIILQFMGFVFLLIILGTAAGLVGLERWGHRDHRQPGVQMTQRIELRAGLSSHGIAYRLYKAKITRSATLMTAFIYLHRAQSHLKAGEYAFAPGTPPFRIIEVLTKGPESQSTKVTIPEGWTASHIADRLIRNGIISSKERFLQACADTDFLTSLGVTLPTADGCLFPDTYFFLPKTEERIVVARMVERFKGEIEQMRLLPGINSPNAYPLNFSDSVILASIIEREAADPSEVQTISSVFHNRLRKEMPLGSCATVRFALQKWNAPLTMDDLKSESPYNTYVHKGLPSLAICNPGRKALDAAFRPAKSDFLYFVYRGNRQHQFSSTLKEHEEARALYKDLWLSWSGKEPKK